MKIVKYIAIYFGTKAISLFEFHSLYIFNSVILIIRIVKKSGILVTSIVSWEVAFNSSIFAENSLFYLFYRQIININEYIILNFK